MAGFFQVAFAVAARQVYKYFTNPAFLAPALFPLFFCVVEAGHVANPRQTLVEGIRSLVITGWDPQALALGFGFALAIVVVAIGGAAASLRTRVA